MALVPRRFTLIALFFACASIAFAQSVGWVADATHTAIPNRPAAGKVHGARFAPTRAELSGGESKGSNGKRLDHSTYFLRLRSGNDFFADQEFQIFIATKTGETLDGKAYVLKVGGNFDQPVKVKTANVTYPAIQGVHMSYKVPGKNLPETEMFMDKATLRLEFGKSSGGKLPGRIYLCVQDAAKSFVAGTFVATRPKY